MKHLLKISYLLVLVAAGCGRQGQKGTPEGRVDSFDSLSSDAILIRVGDASLTKGQLNRMAECQFRLFSSIRKISKRKALAAQARVKEGIFRDFPATSMFVQEAVKQGMSIGEDDLKAARGKYTRTFGKDFDDILKIPELRQYEDVLVARLRQDALTEKYLRSFNGSRLLVTDGMVSNALEHVHHYNEVAKATNDWVFALATNVHERAKAGEDFSKLADLYSEDPEKTPGGLTDEVTGDDYKDVEGYWEAVSQLREGDISPIIQTDVALEIVKLVRNVPSQESAMGKPCKVLSRIQFNLPRFYRDYTPEEARKALIREKRTEVIKQAVATLSVKYAVSYPYGKDILIKKTTQPTEGTK